MPDTSNTQPGVCPRCHRDKLFHLKSMRQHDSRDWFKCDACEHIFTVAPEVESTPILHVVSERDLR
jgi:transposase-like protein